MNAIRLRLRCLQRDAHLPLLVLVVLSRLAGGPGSLRAEEPAPAPPASAYTLFVGADLDVPQGPAYFRMQRFTNYSAEIRVDGRARRVSIRELPSLRIGRETKLSRSTATLDAVKVDRAFSTGNDPFMRWASTQLSAPEGLKTERRENPNLYQDPRNIIPENMEVVRVETFNNPGADMSNTGAFVGRSELERVNGGFDAIEAEFTVSSNEGLSDCYLLLICDFKMREKDERAQRWIHLKTIDSIEPRARKVHFLEGGLPPGFILVAHEFHLYSRGREVATNLSDKRVQLTDEEAFLFLNLQYVAAHRGETLAPVVAWAEAPPSLLDRLPADVLRWPIYVEVDAEGRVVSMAADELGRRAVPQRVEAAIKTFRFNPALEKGRPVPGKAVIRMADFLEAVPE